MPLQDQNYLLDLCRGIGMFFSLEEVQILAAKLGVDWVSLRGKDRPAKTFAMVNTLANSGRLAHLLTLLGERKPEANLHVLPLVIPESKEAVDTKPVNIEDTAFQEYLAQISNLLPGQNLFELGTGNEIWELFESQTLDVFTRLDGELKGQLLRFLHDMKVIGDTAIIDSRRAQLDKATLKGEDLSGANMVGANLSGADLSGATLEGANLSDANLGGADLWGANLTRANLSRARLWGANLNKAILREADLTGARLSKASLWGADLTKANLDGAYLWEANLESAILKGARNLTERQLAMADSLAGITMPDGRRKK